MNNSLKILALCSLVILSYSCRKDTFEVVDSDAQTDYFPLLPGMYHIYSVQRIVFDKFNKKSDTLNLIVKQEQDTFFTNELGQTLMRYTQYSKDTSETGWETVRSYYYVKNNTHIESVIENQRNVILSLPILEQSFWDYNTYNNKPQYLLYYNKELSSYNNQYIKAGKSVEITRLGRNIPFEENKWKEIYSKNIGLVSREFSHIIEETDYLSGIKEKIELIEYGYN